MANDFLRRVKNAELMHKRIGGGMEGATLSGFVSDHAVRAGAAAGWNYAQGRLREKFEVTHGVGYDLIGGVLMMLVGGWLNAKADGKSKAGAFLDRVGDSGLQAYVGSVARSYGTLHAGRVAVVVNQGKALPAPKTGVTGIGMIPPAVAGPYLSANEIANFSQPRR